MCSDGAVLSADAETTFGLAVSEICSAIAALKYSMLSLVASMLKGVPGLVKSTNMFVALALPMAGTLSSTTSGNIMSETFGRLQLDAESMPNSSCFSLFGGFNNSWRLLLRRSIRSSMIVVFVRARS